MDLDFFDFDFEIFRLNSQGKTQYQLLTYIGNVRWGKR